MLSVGFRAQIYPPLLQEPTGWTHKQPQHGVGTLLCRKMKLLGQMLSRGSKRCWSKHLEKIWSLLTSNANSPSTTPLCSATETTSHSAWLQPAQPRYIPLPKDVPPPPSERSTPVPLQPATSHKDHVGYHPVWSPAITATLSHPLLKKTHQILTQSKEHLHLFSFAVPPHRIAGNGLYSSMDALIICVYPRMCSFYSSLLFLMFISSSHLHSLST